MFLFERGHLCLKCFNWTQAKKKKKANDFITIF